MAQPFGWIEVRNQAQLEWISGYLARKSVTGSTLFSSLKHYAEHGYPEMARSLKALPNEMEYREASRQMKGAWNTYKYRKKNGNPVSLQIPEATMKQLKSLAKKGNQSQAQTLSQIIKKAVNDNPGMPEKFKRGYIGTSIDQVNDHCANNGLHCGFEDKLLEILANEIDRRCILEVFLNETKNPELKINVQDEYQRISNKAVEEVEKRYGKELTQLHAKVKEKIQWSEGLYGFIVKDEPLI